MNHYCTWLVIIPLKPSGNNMYQLVTVSNTAFCIYGLSMILNVNSVLFP
jgi:hypothetical protein